MPHISNKELDKNLEKKIFLDLLSILNKSKDKNLLSESLNEILTKVEKIMLAKRISIILMLESGLPQQKITEVLKVSPSTVAKMSLQLEIGKYKSVIKVSKKEKNDLGRMIYMFLTAGGLMPPKVGRKYWRKIK